jgi:hypothetical protein
MASKTKVKSIFHQGLMLIGDVTKRNDRYFVYNPLMIHPLDNGHFSFVPFGMGIFKSPISITTDAIISDPTDYGINEYHRALIEIGKKIDEAKKLKEQSIQ